ncbi:MAG: hypothetical protein ABW321_01965 [Polyangiales bacterium]
MAADTTRQNNEWVGGLVKVPAYVSGDGAPYRPDVLFWLDAHGNVLSSSVAKPGELIDSAVDRLLEQLRRPEIRHGALPTSIRVASPMLATVLREALPALEIVLAPTPEIDALVTLMRERFDQDAAYEQSYLAGGLDAEIMGSFFRASAALFRAAPWQRVPSDQNVFFVTIDELGLHDAVLSVIGQLGESVGFVLFANSADFEAYLSAGQHLERGIIPAMPRHFALHFERGAELSSLLRKEIAHHRWEVASAEGYPWLMAMDEDLVARTPTASEITIAELLARAVPSVLATARPALLAAWDGARPAFRHTLEVPSHAGRFAVTLVATHKLAWPSTRSRIANVFHRPVELDPVT